MKSLVYAVPMLLIAVAVPARAFVLDVRSESPSMTEEILRTETNRMAEAVGNRVPELPSVKVTVYSRSFPSSVVPGRYTYFHRIELRRVVNSPAPYAFAGWVPLTSVVRYGVGDPVEMKNQLDDALVEFFTRLKPIDPAVGFTAE